MGSSATTYIGPYLLIEWLDDTPGDVYEITDGRLHDGLVDATISWAAPNQGQFGRSFDRDDEESVTPLDAAVIQEEVKRMTATFAADIKALRKLGTVTVRWGIVRWWA